MVPAERAVTVGIGRGKKAARCIDAYLRGETYVPLPRHELADFDKLNTWYYTDAPVTVQPLLDEVRRQTSLPNSGKRAGDHVVQLSKRALGRPSAHRRRRNTFATSWSSENSAASARRSPSGSLDQRHKPDDPSRWLTQ